MPLVAACVYFAWPRRAGPALNFPPGADLNRVCAFTAAPRDWQAIVIHHSATTAGNAEVFDRNHRQARGWLYGLGYDFVIGNGKGSADGGIEVSERWREQLAGAHAGDRDMNEKGIGVCLVGDFESEVPTPAQMQSLVQLVRYLQQRFRIPAVNVILHNEIQPGHTVCPGANFPAAELRRQLLP